MKTFNVSVENITHLRLIKNFLNSIDIRFTAEYYDKKSIINNLDNIDDKYNQYYQENKGKIIYVNDEKLGELIDIVSEYGKYYYVTILKNEVKFTKI